MTPATWDGAPGDAAAISKKIDEQLANDGKALEKIIKLLLLGPAESGKSTVLKQIRIIHLNGFTAGDLGEQRPLVFKNVTDAVTELWKAVQLLNYTVLLETKAMMPGLLEELKTINFVICDTFPASPYAKIKQMWNDPAMKMAYDHRSNTNVMDSTKFFLDAIDRISAPSGYTPTVADVLHLRQVTIGVSEMQYTYKDLEFRIFDVGGQKTERRKWIHVFDNVTALFFIAAISEYDQYLSEEDASASLTNMKVKEVEGRRALTRLDDALFLFRWIGNNDLFTKVQIILFLNKKDIFAEKISKIPLTVCFSSYKEKNDYKNATEYIQKRFEAQIRNKNKMIYTHLTCATDTDQVQFLLNSVTDMIIAENFKQTGVI
uniref:G-protein alpha subunit n=1 Tax=Panagrellus redivivus TaxID=6233 RepID=A0A7E4WCR5_PANRE